MLYIIALTFFGIVTSLLSLYCRFIIYSFLETWSTNFPLYLRSSAITRIVFSHFLKHVSFRNFNLIGQSYLGFLIDYHGFQVYRKLRDLIGASSMRKHENWYFTKLHLPSIVSNVHANEYREPLWFNPRPIKQECLFYRDTFQGWIIATLLISAGFSHSYFTQDAFQLRLISWRNS